MKLYVNEKPKVCNECIFVYSNASSVKTELSIDSQSVFLSGVNIPSSARSYISRECICFLTKIKLGEDLISSTTLGNCPLVELNCNKCM